MYFIFFGAWDQFAESDIATIFLNIPKLDVKIITEYWLMNK